MSSDADTDYGRRKADFDRCLTIYGRNPVLEALQSPAVVCERLHLARSNKPAAVLDQIVALAEAQGADTRLHDRDKLAHISRNSREDQGVAADIRWPGYRQLGAELPEPRAGAMLLAVDGIGNPQNLGMLIRSATAGACSGIVLPRQGGCDIGPLVIKASAGALFRSQLLRCNRLPEALGQLRAGGWRISVLEGGATRSVFALPDRAARVFVLGSESRGASPEVMALADERLAIPMSNGVESLNVAVSAALVVFSYALGSAQRLR